MPIRLLMLLGFTGIPRLVLRLLMDRRVPLILKMVFPAAVLYVLSPIDLVPDMLTPLGKLDDILAVLLSVAVFLAFAPRQVIQEHVRQGAGRGRRRGGNGRPRSPGGEIVEGRYRFVDDESERTDS